MTQDAPADAPLPGDDMAEAARVVSWVFLLGFLFISSSARSVYSSHGADPSARFEALYTLGLVVLIWYWLTEQCRPYRASFPLDLAFFASSIGFLLLPYYLWHYERWRGILKVAVLGVGFFLSYAWSVALHYVLVWSE